MNSTRNGNRYIFFIMLFYLLGSLSMDIIVSPFEEQLTSFQSVLINILIGQVGLIFIPLIVYLIVTKRSFKQTLRLNKLPLFSIVLVVLIAFTMQPVVYMVNMLSQLYSSNMIGNYLNEVSSLPYLFLLLCFALVPAINEELTFRGFLLNQYEHVHPIKAALVSGLFFGILHMNLNQFTYAVFIGFIFALLVWITDSIFASMIIHFLVNGTSVTLLKLMHYLQTHFGALFSDEMMNQTPTKDMILSFLPVSIMVAIPFIFILYALFYLLAKEHHKLHLFKKTGKGVSTQTANGNIADDAFEQPTRSPFYKKSYAKIIDPYFIMIIVVFVGMMILQVF